MFGGTQSQTKTEKKQMVLKTDSMGNATLDNGEGKTWEMRYDAEGKPYCYSFKKEEKKEVVEEVKEVVEKPVSKKKVRK